VPRITSHGPAAVEVDHASSETRRLRWTTEGVGETEASTIARLACDDEEEEQIIRFLPLVEAG